MPRYFCAETSGRSWRSFFVNHVHMTRLTFERIVRRKFSDADVSLWDWIKVGR